MSEKVNILIVDDKEKNIYALEQMLSEKNRNFIHAANGRDALKYTLYHDVDLIILDVQMPDMDGFEVAQILKSNKRTRDIPIIFASAEKREHKFMLKGFEEGAIDYLYKPLDSELTKAKVAVLLQLHLRKKELMEKNATLEKYDLLINNCADIIAIINADTLKFEELNQAATTLLGYELGEIKGTSLLFYLAEDDRAKVVQASKQPADIFSFETQIYCKNRKVKWFQWNIVNKMSLWFANARDITGLKEVEEIRNYLAAVVKQSNDAIYLHHPDGKIISWNNGAEAIYGYTEEEARNMNVGNIVPEYLLEESQGVINAIIHGKQIQSLETKRITKYGRIIEVIFSASVITDANGQLKSVAITERDITHEKIAAQEIRQLNLELKKNIAQLEDANRELESFSYSVSHDLRAPLRAIHGYANIISDEYQSQLDDEFGGLFEKIKKNAKKMGELIDDLLAFSKLGRQSLVKLPIDFNELIKQVLDDLKSSMDHHAVIEVKSLPSSEGDHALLNQAVANLVSNAIKYSSNIPEPRIEIGAVEEPDEQVYYIKDNGAGFDMAYVDKLFGVFQRLHLEKDFSGTGVGLAIVKRVIEKHGGRVWAEGQVNQGATFYFSLPKTT